jgi:hypothetical protein
MTATVTDDQEVVEFAERWIRRLREDHEYMVHAEAWRVTIRSERYNNPAISLASGLGQAMNDYELCKHEPTARLDAARIFRIWINKLVAHGLIIENKDTLAQKIKHRHNEITELKNSRSEAIDDNQRISAAYMELLGRYNELNEKLKASFRDGRGGDLQS